MRAGKPSRFWFLILAVIGFTAFQAAQEEWASAAWGLVVVGLFWLLTSWIERHPTQLTEGEARARSRRLAIRALPFFIVVFAVVAIYDLIDDDWFGALFAAVGLGGLSVALWSSRGELRKQ